MAQDPPFTEGFKPRRLGTPRESLLISVLVVLVVASGIGTTGTGEGRGSPPSASVALAPVALGSILPTPIRHVFLIYMENEGVDQIYGKVPFETHLAHAYAWGGDALTHHMTGYYAVCHPSAPNYLAVTSGNPLQCGSDAYHNYTTEKNLFNLLDTAGRSWTAYAESMPAACDIQSSGEYAVRHNPVPFYGNLGGDASGSICRTHDLPLANLTEDYPFGTTPPNFTFIAPNLRNDGHDTSAAVADWFLSRFVSKLVNQTWFSSSAIFVTYDESFGSQPRSGYHGLDGGPVYLASVSPYSKGIGAVDATNASHYNLMSTIEWLLGLPGTGTGHDSTAAFPAMKGLFRFPSTNGYALSGVVTASGTNAPIPGATVAILGGASTTTGTSGGYSVRLTNGSYTVSASAAGFLGSTVTAEVSGSNLTQDFTLLPRVYGLSGSVTNAWTGAAIVGANVSVPNGPSTETNAQGDYGLSLANGTYTVTATARGDTPLSVSTRVSGAPQTQDFALAPLSFGTYVVSGTVTFETAGTAVAGANVTLAGVGTVLTGTTGAYSFNAPNGSYALRVTDPGYHGVDLTVLVNGANLVENVPLTPVLYRWQGEVTTAGQGLPVPNAILSVRGAGNVTTNATGRFGMGLQNGTYSVSIAAAGYQAQEASITISGAPVDQNFSLVRTLLYEISGVVKYASNQSPVQNATVAWNSTGAFRTGGNGTFWFWAGNGSYPLTVQKAGFLEESALVVVHGEAASENFSLLAQTFPLTGIVSSETTGRPIDGANVSLSASDWVLTSPSGGYSFLVANGSYTVQTNASGYAPMVFHVVVNGQPVSQGVALPLAPPNATPTGRFGAPAEPWESLGVGALAAGLLVAGVLLLRRRRREHGTPRAPPP